MKVHWLVVKAIVPLVFCSTCLAENFVLNPSFEGDFIGGVAEHWTAWGSADSYYEGGVVHEGQKSQGILYQRYGPGGIYQNRRS